MTNDMPTGERIRARREALGITQAELASELGLNQSTVAKWESGPNTPRPRTLQRLAEILKVTMAWLIGEDDSSLALQETDTLRLAFHERAAIGRRGRRPGRFGAGRELRDLPVLGVAVGGDDAFFELNGQVHEYVERPAQLDGVANAYALYVVGTSMEPRYMEGEIVYINPNRPVTKGCFVAVELTSAADEPDTGMIKQFDKRTGTKLVLKQFNPARAIDVPLGRVKHCHRIVQSGEP